MLDKTFYFVATNKSWASPDIWLSGTLVSKCLQIMILSRFFWPIVLWKFQKYLENSIGELYVYHMDVWGMWACSTRFFHLTENFLTCTSFTDKFRFVLLFIKVNSTEITTLVPNKNQSYYKYKISCNCWNF